MKKLWCIITVAVLLVSLATTVSAQTLPLVIDDAGLLTESELEELTQNLQHIKDNYAVDVVIVTAQLESGVSVQNYADNYYDDHGYADDGVLLLVDMQQRQWYISTTGRCIDAVDVDTLADSFLSYLSDGDYYDAFFTFAMGCEKAVHIAPDEEFILTDSGGVKQNANGNTVLICIGIGLAVGLITVLVMKGQLKTVRSQNMAGNYVTQGLQLTGSSDMFLYHTTTRREKPQNNTTHRSSSGRSHGGGGGRF